MLSKNLCYYFLPLLLLTSCSVNPDDEPNVDPNPVPFYGQISGHVTQLNEYGMSAFIFDEHESSTVTLMNSNQEIIKTISTQNEVNSQLASQKYSFDSLETGTYFLTAESPLYKTCKVFEIEISEDQPEFDQFITLKSNVFSSTLNSFSIDSLVGEKLYHSFDITKESGKTLGIRMYVSDHSGVNNQDYKETLYNLSSWPEELSGQFYTHVEINSELYVNDSIYISAYLVNYEYDECIGDKNLTYHFPFAQNYITVGIEK